MSSMYSSSVANRPAGVFDSIQATSVASTPLFDGCLRSLISSPVSHTSAGSLPWRPRNRAGELLPMR